MLLGAQTLNAKTYDLTICRYDTMFSRENNDMFMILYTEDYIVTPRLDIILEEGQQFFTNGKTYTWDDMVHKFCFAYVRDEYREIPFVDATFTWSLDELGLEHFYGCATDSEGNVYNYHYDVLPYIPTGDTIDVTFSQSMKMEHTEEWYFSGSEGEYYLLLTLFNDAESPVGHYTEENIDMDFSYIDKDLGGGDYELIYFHHADITITAAADDTLMIDALIAALDTNVYHFHTFYVEPKPLNKVTLTATDLYINTDYLYGMVGAIQVEASNDKNYVKLALSPMSQDLNIYDTYPLSNLSPNAGYVIDYVAGEDEASEVYEGTVTITRTDSGAVVTGTLLCYNNIEYTLHLSLAVPEKTRETNLTIEGLDLQMSTQGAWRIYGYDAELTQFVSLVFNGFGIEGTYSLVEMSPIYSSVVTDITWAGGEPDAYNYYELKSANLTVTLNPADSVVTVTGTIIALNTMNPKDAPQFTVQLKSKATTEDIENVRPEAAATKRLENGMIVIEKNGVKYSLTGALIR